MIVMLNIRIKYTIGEFTLFSIRVLYINSIKSNLPDPVYSKPCIRYRIGQRVMLEEEFYLFF